MTPVTRTFKKLQKRGIDCQVLLCENGDIDGQSLQKSADFTFDGHYNQLDLLTKTWQRIPLFCITFR